MELKNHSKNFVFTNFQGVTVIFFFFLFSRAKRALRHPSHTCLQGQQVWPEGLVNTSFLCWPSAYSKIASILPTIIFLGKQQCHGGYIVSQTLLSQFEKNLQPGFSLSESESLQEMPGRCRTDVMSLMIGKFESISFTDPQQKSEETMASRLKTFAQFSVALS